VVLAAKALVVAVPAFLAGLASSGVACLLGTVTITGDHPTGEPFPALIGVGASFAALAVLGLALGTILRHSAGAVAVVVGVTLVPALVAPAFGDAQRWVAGASPTSALEKMTQTPDAAVDAVGSLGPWPSLALVAGYTVIALAGAAAILGARDV
jgi:ABC-2 type transport system permease protein